MDTADRCVYFLHIPKAAGSSTTRFFHDSYDGSVICPHHLWDGLATADPSELRGWRVYCGHFGGLLPLWLRAWPRTVTVLRDPVWRTISHIKHVRRDRGHPLHELATGKTVREYCSHPVLRKSVENFQSRYLASLCWAQAILTTPRSELAVQGQISVGFESGLFALDRGPQLLQYAIRALESLDAVGIAEQHAETVRLFARALGVAVTGREYRLNAAAAGEEAALELSSSDFAAIDAITEIDRPVYERAIQLFDTALRCANADTRGSRSA